MIIGTIDTKSHLIIAHEVSAIPSNFIVLMDKKLNEVYDPNKILGGNHELLSRGFLWKKSADTSICNSLCAEVTDFDANFRKFISEINFFHVDEKVRPKCPFQKKMLKTI